MLRLNHASPGNNRFALFRHNRACCFRAMSSGVRGRLTVTAPNSDVRSRLGKRRHDDYSRSVTCVLIG